MERINDEQMEMINGGNLTDTLGDARALHDKGLLGDSFNMGSLINNWNRRSSQVDGAWKKLGITCVTKPSGSNLYFYEGREISRKEAYGILGAEINDKRRL